MNGLQVFLTETKIVGEVHLVALLFEIGLVGCNGLVRFLVAAVDLGQFLVVVQLGGILLECILVGSDSSGHIVLLLGQSGSILIVEREEKAVCVFSAGEVSSSFLG